MADKHIALTHAEISHVYSVMIDVQAGGDYYGNPGQYYTRHQRIMDKLIAAMPDRLPSSPRRGEGA